MHDDDHEESLFAFASSAFLDKQHSTAQFTKMTSYGPKFDQTVKRGAPPVCCV
jgi:hypothetical protein